MQVQLSALDDKVNVHARLGKAGAAFVTFTGTGNTTANDSLCFQHADPLYLADVFEEAAVALRRASLQEQAA